MYEIVETSKEFEICRLKLGRFPFVVQSSGVPVVEINEYLLYLGIDRKRNVLKTVWPAARYIVNTINEVNSQVSSSLRKKKYEHGLYCATKARLLLYRNKLVQLEYDNDYINDILYTACAFFWWSEKEGYCEGLIGFNDAGKSKVRYRIPVDPVKGGNSKLEFKLSIALKSVKGKKIHTGSPSDWDRAIEAALDTSSLQKPKAEATRHRDEIMIRLIRESGLRRLEVAGIRLSEFERESRESEVFVELNQTKIYSFRDARIDGDFYDDIRDYIKKSRKIIMEGKKESDALLPSLKTGGFLHRESINQILNKYGIKPQEGRSIGLTERFRDLIESGLGKEECLFIVTEEAGHKRTSEGKTLIDHYLRALQLVKGGALKPRAALETENYRLKKEVERLERMLDE
jgi:integrase